MDQFANVTPPNFGQSGWSLISFLLPSNLGYIFGRYTPWYHRTRCMPCGWKMLKIHYFAQRSRILIIVTPTALLWAVDFFVWRISLYFVGSSDKNRKEKYFLKKIVEAITSIWKSEYTLSGGKLLKFWLYFQLNWPTVWKTMNLFWIKDYNSRIACVCAPVHGKRK